MKRLVALIGLVVLVVFSPATASQDATPTSQAGTNTIDYLPATETIGEGWAVMVPVDTQTVNTAVWAATADAVYAGPGGARITLVVRFVHPNREAIVEAADIFDSWLGEYVYGSRFEAGEEIEGTAITGCDESQRAQGLDDLMVPAGVSTCSVGLDVILLAQVSGEVNGLTGTAASDFVIEKMLENAAH